MSEIYAPVVETDGVLRPTQVVVDLGALRANFAALRAHIGGRPVVPILKANAYGHGLVPVARAMAEAGAELLGVAYLEEALLLRRAGLSTDILVLGGLVGSQIPAFLAHGLTITASSVDKVRALDAAAGAMGTRAIVHLKFDTGMGRIGQHWTTAGALVEAALAARHVEVRGIYSHLATADEVDDGFVTVQLERFLGITEHWTRRGLPVPTRHLANSAAILGRPDTWLDAVRPGLALYGVQPAPQLALPHGVRPALQWTSRVVYFKVVRAGDAVSYGGRWAATAPTRVVTVPVGYGDGYMRAMSGSAEVVVHGRRCPVVGTICMDMLLVDLGPEGTAYNGDPVLLLGEADGHRIRAEDLARWAGTVPWEVLTAINTRVPRRYIG